MKIKTRSGETFMDIVTNSNFWDCECDENYIHRKTEKKCEKCGAHEEDQPDSLQDEINEMFLSREGKANEIIK